MRISIFDLGSKYLLPALKRTLVQTLVEEYGYTQKDVAKLTGMDKSLVSRYMSNQRGGQMDLAGNQLAVARVRELCRDIVDKRVDGYGIWLRLYEISFELMAAKGLCRYHEKLDASVVASKCQICPSLFQKR